MNQTLLALGALVAVTLLSFSMRDGVHRHERTRMRSDVETAAVDLAVSALDRLAALPVAHDPAAPPATPTLDSLRSVDEANGLVESIDVRMDTSSVALTLALAVDPVRKQAGSFVPTATPTPFRRVTVRVNGPLESEVMFERLYSSGDPVSLGL